MLISSTIVESQKTFCSLALTSKRFLPLAREYLYHQPLSEARVGWEEAKALYWTLKHTSHGQLVSSLEAISLWVGKLDASASSESNLPFQLTGFGKAFSWYFAIVEACTRLRTIAFFANTPRNISRLFKALESSSVTLRSVTFGNPRNVPSSLRMTSRQIYDALHYPLVRNLERIFIGNFKAPNSILDLVSPASIPGLKEVILGGNLSQLKHFKPLLPSNPSSLTDFSLFTWTRTTEDLLWILNYIPSTLRTLRIRPIKRTPTFLPSATSYLLPKALPQIPANSFPSLSSLRTLALNGFQGPSLRFLQALSTSSPSLVVINFAESYWVPNESIDLGTSHYDFRDVVFPQDKIFDTLSILTQLRSIEFGYLPTRHRSTYRPFKEKLNRAGIDSVKWTQCRPHRPICSQCGERH
ncbi:hypothetical protein JCM5350_003419 [Sporobolomyces pararoseus]